ncbi:MAG: hypothetical protein RR338_05560, partial [Clostridia bacterium]
DINDRNFYDSIKVALSSKEGLDAYNYVVIAFGTDLENVDFAEKLSVKLDEWGIADTTKLFVKVRNQKLASEVLVSQGKKKFQFFSFGTEESVVFSYEQITHERIEEMAKLRNRIYQLEYEVKHSNGVAFSEEQIAEIKKSASDGWFSMNNIKRQSNIYACLSLRTKMQLIGLDYCVQTDSRKAVTEEEYLRLYAEGFPVEYASLAKIDGKRIISYTLDFPPSKRTNLAIQEHSRWNAYAIASGMVPASTEKEILNKAVKCNDYDHRRHANITTFEGLVKYRKMIAKRDGICESDADVIMYDIQLMDDAFWLLQNSGCQIVEVDIN